MQAVNPYKSSVNTEDFTAIKGLFRDAIGAYFNPKRPDKIFVMTSSGGIDGPSVETVKRSELAGKKPAAQYNS